MWNCNQNRFAEQVRHLRDQFARTDDLPFRSVLSPELASRVLAESGCGAVDCIYTPLTTLLVFLWQVLSPDHSCRGAVAKLLACRTACGKRACSGNTGAYCQARQRLPEEVVARMVRATGSELDQQAPASWRWRGRRVQIFDGSTVSMPDTAANQAAYPQHGRQAPGLGFPIARIAALFSLSCGAVLDLALCSYAGKGQSELGLLRQLWHQLQPGDLLLTDRYLCSCLEWMVLADRDVDCVARLHARRKFDFRRGKRLGKDDHLVEWRKPRRPPWMDAATYQALPETLLVRELRVRVAQTGFRTRSIVIATTLLNAEDFTARDLAELYRARWHAELDLRSLKVALQMDVLRCHSPDMVRKEIWTHLLAYNLIRTLMAEAAVRHHLPPRTISFKGTLQTLVAFQGLFLTTPQARRERYERLLNAIAQHRVGNRPDRYQPRARKRRPKPYPLLTVPRHDAIRALYNSH